MLGIRVPKLDRPHFFVLQSKFFSGANELVRKLLVTTNENLVHSHCGDLVISLGEWCSDLNNLPPQLVKKTLPYHWDDREKLASDSRYLKIIYEQALTDLTDQLNCFHKVRLPKRFWRILVGPWLGVFLQILFDRWYMLNDAFTQYSDLKCTFIDYGTMFEVPNDMADFLKKSVRDDWNQAIYQQIIRHLYPNNFTLDQEFICRTHIDKDLCVEKRNTLACSLKQKFRSLADHNFWRPSEDKFFMISTYLPLWSEIKLSVSLGQIPRKRYSPPTPAALPLEEKRKWDLNCEKQFLASDNFFDLFLKLIPQNIPSIYLEGFDELRQLTRDLNWSKKPKTIFTSSAFSGDDVFKCWTAQKVLGGSSLVIGQHGGNIGMSSYSFFDEHQIEIADKFLAWGKQYNNQNVKPVGNFVCRKNRVKTKRNGGGCLITTTVPRFSYHLRPVPIATQWLVYFDEQVRFVNALNDQVRKSFTVKLSAPDYGWHQEKRWRSACGDVHLESGASEITRLAKNSRICVSSYNGTSFIETLVSNAPTIIFWNPGLWELKPDAAKYFKILSAAKIFHETPESAADHLCGVWSDVGDWWFSCSVQSAKEAFLSNFSDISSNSINKIQDALKLDREKVS